MSRTVIEVNNIGKKYKLGEYTFGWNRSAKEELWALRNISFKVKEGDALGIIGNNGSGKSTLLKILSRITTPSEGHARVVGKVRTILEVGTGFQGELTGRENIYLNGSLLGMSSKEIQQKFDEIVEFSEIEKFIDTPVKRYSSGMYVRLAFAVAANLNPDILIVDEVLAVGDINFQRKCLEKLEEGSKNRAQTIIFVSHNLTAIRNFCKRALLLQNGKLLLDAGVDDVVEKFLENSNQVLELGKKNLKDRLNRTTGKVRFSSIEARNINNELTWRFYSGEMVNFQLKYKVFESVPSLTLLFFIRTLDQKILTTIKKILSVGKLDEGYEGVTNLCLPNLPLRAGEFGLYICFGEIESGVNHDVIDENIVPYLMIQSEEEDLELRKGFFTIDCSVEGC